MGRVKSILLFLTFLTVVIPFGYSQKPIPQKPNPPRIVNDFAGILQANERASLERKLVAYNDTSSTQIAIVTEQTINGADIFEYSYELAQTWGIGQKGKDNGILIFIAFQDRNLFIQTGSGAEGFLPDAIAKRIVDQVITPAFRQKQYYKGLNDATNVIMDLGSGEYRADQTKRDSKIPLGAILMLIVVIVILLLIFSGGDDDDDGGYYRGGRYDEYGRRRRGRDRGGWIFIPGGGGGGSSWGGGGGGFGGGGFGGFGGGGFSGGGAGGSW